MKIPTSYCTSTKAPLLALNTVSFTRRYVHGYDQAESFSYIANRFGAIRIFERASKLRSPELMEQFFGISHSRRTYYKIAPDCADLKKGPVRNGEAYLKGKTGNCRTAKN